MPTAFPSTFSAADRLMWRIERDPVLRSPIVVVGTLDREPDRGRVIHTLDRAVGAVPRLRQVVCETRGRTGRLGWEDDPHFRLESHVRHLRIPHPGSLRQVLDLAATEAAAPFDPARPLWDLDVMEGLEGGRGAFVLRFHHTITDGIGGIDLAGSVFDRDRRGRPLPGPDQPMIDTNGSGAAANRWGDLLRAGVDAARHPDRTAVAAARTARSVARILEPVSEPLSPVLLGRSVHRHMTTSEVALPLLVETAHALDATVNEVFLAAVAGGLHDYHSRLGHPIAALRFTMPISVRRADDPPGGNRFTPARFTLPIDDPDPVARVRIVQAIVRRWRHEPAVRLTDVLAGALDLVPAPLVTSVFGSMLRNIDVDAVDVPGLSGPAFLGGARIDRMWAFAPPTGAAVSVTLLSHTDTACIGVLCDLAAVAEPAMLQTCLDNAFDEIVGTEFRDGAP